MPQTSRQTTKDRVIGPVAGVATPATVTEQLQAMMCAAAEDLWDAATSNDPGDLWEDSRRIASRLLAACPKE